MDSLPPTTLAIANEVADSLQCVFAKDAFALIGGILQSMAGTVVDKNFDVRFAE